MDMDLEERLRGCDGHNSVSEEETGSRGSKASSEGSVSELSAIVRDHNACTSVVAYVGRDVGRLRDERLLTLSWEADSAW